MATKMEVVLSPGNLGGDDGAPFRNEDVREWSRVDRITGMLERARVETGRWRANTRDAAQSYGKMIDSRERNSADGSLVQKARRQVEIFQSQGTSGRSFQVVRASQWSSSRATDIAFDVPMTKPSTTQFPSEPLNGTSTPTIPTPAPRLSLWRASLDNGASDLDRLSCLCRKLHDEAMNSTNLWSSLRARSPSPLSSLENTSPRFQEIEPNNLDASDRLSTSSLGERRSNSTEDLSSLLNVDEAFARDCKTRRSLQVHNSENKEKVQTEGERTRRRNEFIAERARRFEEGARESENGVGSVVAAKRNFISTKSFTSIADNEFVKSDPKHPSKFNQQFAKISIQDAVPALQTNGHAMHHHHHVVASPRFDTPPAPAPRKANNKTVVHLRNAASPTAETAPPPRCINVTAIKLDNEAKDAETVVENGAMTYGVLMDAKEETTPTTMTTTAVVNGGSKPVKKVEFCKTEIHFAADSGKVNIVETDGKPPPTNKFRRRRRNSSVGAAASNNAQKSNMPLVHFGDTSYEKYIFGGQGKLPQDGVKTAGLLNDGHAIEDVGKSYIENGGEVDGKKDRWDAMEKVRDDGTKEKDNSQAELAGVVEKVGENGAGGKYRGTHTTTVNFLSDEISNGNNSSVVPKVAEGKMRAKGIRLQFASTNRGLSPLANGGGIDDDEENCVSRTTKITVHLPPVMSHHPRILQNNPFTNLKSVKLVMSIGSKTATSNDSSLTLRELLSTLYSSDPSDGLMMDEDRSRGSSQLWSLQVKSSGSSEDDRSEDGEGRRILDESRMLTDKPSNAFATTNHIPTIQRVIEPVSTEKLPHKTPVLAKDADSNQVLLKIVTTHKPMLARVENDHVPIVAPIPKPRTIDSNTREKSPPTVEDEGIGLEAKDHCDTVNGTSADEAPTYENIFEALSDGAPVYENFQVLGSKPLVVIKEKKIVKEKVPVKKRSSSVHAERTISSNDSYDRRHKKVSAKLSNGSSVGNKPEKVASSRSITPMSTLSKASSHSVDNGEPKRANGVSSRANSSRDNSVKRYKDVRQDGTTRSNESRRRSSSSKTDPAMKDHKGTMSSVNSERNGGSLRTKKPVEVVYQTAVFNMKNEKLSKPAKAKEIKGPRLINDLICGSKMRRPSDGKKAIKTAIVSQNTSKRKETPTTINR